MDSAILVAVIVYPQLGVRETIIEEIIEEQNGI